MHVLSLEKSDRWSWAGTRKRHGVHSNRDTVAQVLRERDRGGKSFWKGPHSFIFAEADTEWYAEQIAHSISRDASELEVTWSLRSC